MDKLPNEMLSKVLSYLQLENRKAARLVSKKWRNASYIDSIFNQEVVVVDNYQDFIKSYISQHSFTETFKPINIKLVIKPQDILDPETTIYEKAFWANQGVNLKSMNITIPVNYFEFFFVILQCCPKLENLSLKMDAGDVYKELLDFTFPKNLRLLNLLSLEVRGDRHFTIPLLQNVILNAPLLKRIKLVCGTGWCFSRNFHQPIAKLLNLRQLNNLKHLDVQCSRADNECIDNISESLRQQLEFLHCEKLADSALGCISNKCHHLRQLILGNWNFNSDYIFHTFSSLTKLTVVSFFCCNNLDDNAIASLNVLHSLAHLNISNCRAVMDLGISKIFNNEIRPSLIELRFINLQITDKIIAEIAPLLPNLTILNLMDCREIGVSSLKTLSIHNKILKCFILDGCVRLNLEVRRLYNGHLPPYLTKLTTLVHFGAKELVFLSHACDRNLQLPHLKVLDYSVYPFDVLDLINRCPSLMLINDFCCTTKTNLQDTKTAALARKSILDCAKSPLGPCNFQWYTDSLQLKQL